METELAVGAVGLLVVAVGLLVAALWALDLRSSKRTEKVHERLDHLSLIHI